MQSVLIILGPPGSGKNTQGEFLAKKFKFGYFDAGSYLRTIFEDPKKLQNPFIKQQRSLSLAGGLVNHSWLLRIVKKEIKKLFNQQGGVKQNRGLVITGIPRSYYQAFGDRRTKGLFEFLEKTIEKKNIFIVWINISLNESIKRNSKRGREDDKIEKIKLRFQVYNTNLLPIFSILKKQRYKLIKIDGTPSPSKVTKLIIENLKKLNFRLSVNHEL
ncbi:MAG: nucleoside monophosphate kinase [Candidatus Liptonbacteria bacterium]|nr:nucleoside monophosphate kinase [Candidatus Liptonbacteria bacterium]